MTHTQVDADSAEALRDAGPSMARWATGPGAIDRLAERVAER